MSRYEELAALAVKHHREEMEYTEACERAIEVLGRELANYLGAPRENVVYQEVLSGLKLGQLRNPVASGFVGGFSTPNGDGHRYAAIRTTFGPPNDDPVYVSVHLIGVRRAADGFVARILNRDGTYHEFPINPADGSSVEGFCEWMCAGHRQFFTTPIAEDSRPFGFAAWIPRS